MIFKNKFIVSAEKIIRKILTMGSVDNHITEQIRVEISAHFQILRAQLSNPRPANSRHIDEEKKKKLLVVN